jgi:hypothetical protein
MSVFHEQRICAKLCVKVGKSVTETFEMLKISFGEEAICRTQTYEWWKRFKEGRTSVDDDPRRDGHQRRKVTIMLQRFVNSSVQIVV